MKNFKYIQLILAITLFSTLSLSHAETPASESIHVKDPYARAVPPGQPNSAIFLQLENISTTAHSLIKVSSNVSKTAELHAHIHEGGMMKMRRIDKIDIPAQGQTKLQPGGLHIMLVQLQQTLKIGDIVIVTLEFEDNSEITVQAPVRKIMMKGMMMDMGKMKH